MIISKYDNYLITEPTQAIIVGANYIRPKQRFTAGHIQYALTVKGRERKNIKELSLL